MNTEIHYMYRDASNYKRGKRVVVAGELTFEQLRPFLSDGCNFIAGDVGLDDLQLTWQEDGFDFPTDDDHVYSEITDGDLQPTADEPTVDISAAELLVKFQEIGGNWNEGAAMARMGITV